MNCNELCQVIARWCKLCSQNLAADFFSYHSWTTNCTAVATGTFFSIQLGIWESGGFDLVWFSLVWPMAMAMLASSGTIIHYPGTKFRISILNVVCVAMWSALAILLWRQQIATGLVFVSYKSRMLVVQSGKPSIKKKRIFVNKIHKRGGLTEFIKPIFFSSKA